MSRLFFIAAMCLLCVTGTAIAQGPAAKPPEDRIVGRWSWFNGHVMIVDAGGTINGQGASRWRCVDAQARRYKLSWHNGMYIDTVVLSKDGKRLSGQNQNGTRVSGVRLETGAARLQGKQTPTPSKPLSVQPQSNSTLARALQVAGAIKGCHDPSRIIYADGKYWIFSTAENLNLRWSLDLENWQWATRKPFSCAEGVPSWMTNHLRGEGGAGPWNLWAPDIIKSGDKYLLFYSRNCGRGAAERSVCGVATSTSLLNPNWVDQGAVLDIKLSETHYRVIDPAPVFDTSGHLWLAVGSFGSPDRDGWNNGGIRLFEISSATGKLMKAGDNGTRIAGSWIEAPFIYYKSGYYYLFFNEGQCCRGLNSTYFIRMGRSQRITGPYVDKEGNDLCHRGGSLFMGIDRARNSKANPRALGREIGPGHVGISTVPDGTDVVTYHYYDGDTPNGEPTLGMRIIRWGNDGWPNADK